VIPIDTTPPCPVNFTVKSECDLERNLLTWKLIPDDCYENIEYLNIYYSNSLEGEPLLIQKIENANDTLFYHSPGLTLAACYVVTAVDSAGNESSKNYKICNDECHYYELPNVFTPNGDNINDLYHPHPYKFVEKVKMQIFNRWGTLIYETEDPDINWNGTDMNSGKLVSDGVYWYLCDVYEYRLTGLEARNLSGFIHIYGDEKSPNP
jgi:gliding motility-associated-like protein